MERAREVGVAEFDGPKPRLYVMAKSPQTQDNADAQGLTDFQGDEDRSKAVTNIFHVLPPFYRTLRSSRMMIQY